MTLVRLASRSLAYFWRTHVAVALGVATAVAVLAGSLLVGASVRESLRSIATGRLGNTSAVVASAQPFTESLAQRWQSRAGSAQSVAPLLSLTGIVTHEASSQRASRVNVYGVDDRFFAFHGVAPAALTNSSAWLSADLARELNAQPDQAIVVRVAKPTDIPLDSLHGRREEVGRSIRLTIAGTLSAARMGEFSISPTQGPVRSVFVSLRRLQRDLSLADRVNALLIGGPADAQALRRTLADTATLTDLGLRLDRIDDDTAVVEASAGLVRDEVASVVERVGRERGMLVSPVLTWLATSIDANNRSVPYSLVSAVDATVDPQLASLATTARVEPPIVLTEWTARELAASTGMPLELEYYRWTDEGRLVTEREHFRVAGVIPLTGVAIDRRWAPDYPGITTATDVSSWDPPFPIDLARVRPQDEKFWDDYRTAPKAFIPLAAGQKMWNTRHGQLTSIRLRQAAGAPAIDRGALEADIARALDPIAAGFNVVDVRSQNLAAAGGATDFGAYFSYFSAFLMIAALLLAALFFRLSIEQRVSQIGVLRAAGFSLGDVRRAVWIETAAVVALGTIAGVVFAIGWAALMMFALRTWWVGAVGTTRLVLHVDPSSLAAGAAGTAIAAFVAVGLTVRAIGRLTPRALLSGATSNDARRRTRALWPAALLLAAAIGLAASASAKLLPAAAAFFGAGALVLVAALAALRWWLARPNRSSASLRGLGTFGLRNASWRPGRSLTVVGLVAAAVFLLVAVDSFRKVTPPVTARDSGTGGFSMIAESELPIVHDLSSKEGREAAGATSTLLADPSAVRIVSLRLRPGDDTSCLNLYQPKQPRVASIPADFAREGRFVFASVVPADAERERNPWLLLEDTSGNAAIPAIVDQTSLQYVLHAAVGDVITIDAESAHPRQLRIVASLADSVLQGEILIADAAFRRIFPDVAGYRLFLIDTSAAPATTANDITAELESAFSTSGLDVEQTTERLEAFHRVENTYLSTFQALGGLGLVLGCVGVIAIVLRNILERRRELALLGAAGFTGRDLQRVVAFEHASLVAAGLGTGLAAAALAVAPVLASRGSGIPWHALIWLTPVAAAGLIAAFAATRGLRRLPLGASLRSE